MPTLKHVQYLEDDRNSFFLLDEDDSTSELIVFCHGCYGNSIKSWGDMADIIYQDERFASCDALFLGYEKSPSSIDLLAHWVLTTLLKVFPEYVLCDEGHIQLQRKYTSLRLVGHSVGALALRRMLVKSQEQKCCDELCSSTRLVLFAPPLRGVAWDIFVKEARKLDFILGTALSILEPIRRDLTPDSPFLSKLRETSEANLRNETLKYPRAHLVLGASDRIIDVADLDDFPYSTDTLAVLIDQGHRSVCKPRRGAYMRPVEELLEMP